MDRLAFIGAGAASAALDRQAIQSHNVSNVSTPGFRAQLDVARAVPVQSDGRLQTRTSVAMTTPQSLMSHGNIEVTGRPLDVAMAEDAWMAVADSEGNEAYTRRGDLSVLQDGTLVNGSGHRVIGEGGAIIVPQGAEVSIGESGVVSVIGLGDNAREITQVGQIKLVKGTNETIIRRDDGLFASRVGYPLPSDPSARLVTTALESSNINVVDGMVSMISAARQFEFSTRVMEAADKNSERADSLLRISR